MFELSCPSCDSVGVFDLGNYLHSCQFCSSSFRINSETGRKELFNEHFIVPNYADATSIKSLAEDWISRINHYKSNQKEEFIISGIQGIFIPVWIISLDVFTQWKGLAKRSTHSNLDQRPGSQFIMDRGDFKRTYRWAIVARHNLFETWGIHQLHRPHENIVVDWDGFPLDSTFSRGMVNKPDQDKTVLDTKEPFDYKFTNGLAIRSVQISEEEAVRRATFQTQLYHYKLASENVDRVIDIKYEHEIVSAQLIDIPFWHATYQYHPRTFLKFLHKPSDKNLLIEGSHKAIILGEVPIIRQEKLSINAIICLGLSFIFFLVGMFVHSSLHLVALFCFIVSVLSVLLAKPSQMSSSGKSSSSKTVASSPSEIGAS